MANQTPPARNMSKLRPAGSTVVVPSVQGSASQTKAETWKVNSGVKCPLCDSDTKLIRSGDVCHYSCNDEACLVHYSLLRFPTDAAALDYFSRRPGNMGLELTTAFTRANKTLLYHITPVGNFLWNLQKIIERLDLFDHVYIAVAQGDGLVELSKFRGLLPDRVVIETFPNDLNFRESLTFPWLMEQASKHDGTTLYAHTKGVTRGDDLAVYLWTAAMYYQMLNPKVFRQVETALRKFPIVGAFKRYGKFSHFPAGSVWHYSGTFFWFRNADMFSRPWREKLIKHRYGVEAFPSFIFKSDEAFCAFADRCQNPYDLNYLRTLKLL